MAYYPNYYGQQPYPYQDQLSQLRNTPMAMPGQTFQQPAMQSPMMTQRPDNSGVLWVQGEAGAKSWFVNPGSTVLLLDSEAMRFYLKSADMNGVPAMRTFEYSEVGADKPAQPAEAPKFVTIDEYNQFRTDVLTRLDELAQPVEVSLSRKRKGVNADE